MTSVLSVFKRYRELVIASVLLLYPFVSLLTHGAHPRKEGALDHAVLWATSPIERALTWSVAEVSDGWHGYVALHGVRERNVALEKENAQLRGEVTRLSELKAENARLASLARFVQAHPRSKVSARIIGVDPVSTFLSVRIDRGTADGVGVGMPVVTPVGVLGEVIRVNARSADVLLIQDPNSAVAVRLQRSRARGTAVGTGGDEALSLQNLLRKVDAKDGDAVVTAGTDGIFPPGLLVGRLEDVHKPLVGMFQTARIRPAVEPTEVEDVLVLTPPPLPELAEGKAASTRSPKQSERFVPPVRTPAHSVARRAEARPEAARKKTRPGKTRSASEARAPKEKPSTHVAVAHRAAAPAAKSPVPVTPEAPADKKTSPEARSPRAERHVDGGSNGLIAKGIAVRPAPIEPRLVPVGRPVAADGGKGARRVRPVPPLGSPVLRSVARVAPPKVRASEDGGTP